MLREVGRRKGSLIEEGQGSRSGRGRLDNSIQPNSAVHLMGAEFTQSELKQWWKDSAHKWLANPNADPELLYVAYIGLELTEPELSRQCLEECRVRRRRRKK